MKTASAPPFNPQKFLETVGEGRRLVHLKPKGVFFSQGAVSNCVFYLQTGRAKLTVLSSGGKEAAISACTALRIDHAEMVRVLHHEHSFSDLFVRFLIARGIRTQADLVDQLFNSSEKRLARTLLLMAEFGKPGEPETMIPAITQEALAEIIGTTRSRVSFFMNRFRKLGFIQYNGRIHVHKSLLNVVLHDNFSGHNSERPAVRNAERTRTVPAKKARRTIK